MNKEKWLDIISKIEDKFNINGKGSEHLDEEGGIDIEFIEFLGPLGKMRLEFISRPAIVDKKTIYSRRIGSETKVEYIYSDTEKSEKLLVYKWEEAQGEWVEIEAGSFNL